MLKSYSKACLTNKIEPVPRIRFQQGVIFYQRSLRYLKTAGLLHIVTAIGGVCFIGFGRLASIAMETPAIEGMDLLFLFSALYGLVLIFFSQADARSRYQNYKQVKDLLHENGFDTRIINLFCHSRCQRDALRVAASDLGMTRQMAAHFKAKGYRWYHLLPNFIFKRPQLLFTVNYWQKTLFVKTYDSRYFLW